MAKLLESNMLKKVWVLSPEERAHRQLVRARRQIVDHRSDVMHQIKSLLLFHSIEVPFSSRQQWTGPFVKWLHEVDLGNEYLNRSLKALVELFDYLSAELVFLRPGYRRFRLVWMSFARDTASYSPARMPALIWTEPSSRPPGSLPWSRNFLKRKRVTWNRQRQGSRLRSWIQSPGLSRHSGGFLLMKF